MLAAAASGRRALHTVRGTVQRVIFRSLDSDFAVLSLRVSSVQGEEAPPPELAPGGTVLVAGKGGLAAFESGPLVVKGSLGDHPTYGRQLRCASASAAVDAAGGGSPEELAAFLGSGLFKGLGPVTAGAIVAHFGEGTLDVLNNVGGSFLRLREVKGVGPRLLRSLGAAWATQRSNQELITFLQRHGGGVALAHRAMDAFGSAAAALAAVRADPYQLALRVPRVGFPTADALAASILGPAAGDAAPARLHAAAVHVLRGGVAEGHTCLPAAALAARAAALLGGTAVGLPALLGDLVQQGHLVRALRAQHVAGVCVEEDVLALPAPAAAEHAIASRLFELQAASAQPEAAAPCQADSGDWAPLEAAHVATDAPWSLSLRDAVAAVAADTGEALAPEQVAAVATALSAPVSIITGGPGTGKTHALRALVEAWRLLGRSVALACPTARAAHRVNAAIGLPRPGVAAPATTLHKLLEYGRAAPAPVLSAGGGTQDASVPAGGGWRYGRHAKRPLPAQTCIVDEASMLDSELAAALLAALAPGADTALVLVGDADQLPSVGAGRVFADLAASGLVPVTRLHTLFRQAARSSIKRNAVAVNEGRLPTHFAPLDAAAREGEHGGAGAGGSLLQDCFWVDAPSAADVVRCVTEQALPHALGAGTAPADIQVLAPTRRGPAGTDTLNAALQRLLNPLAPLLLGGGEAADADDAAAAAQLPPHARAWLASAVRLCVGDRVMQVVNDYSKGVINGDTGRVVRVEWAGGAVEVAADSGRLRVHARGRSTRVPHTAAMSRGARVTVEFADSATSPGARVQYTLGEAHRCLSLSYATTVHKAQGNEWPVVIAAVHPSAYLLLSRGLLYTALSRAAGAAYLVGTRSALATAVRNTAPAQRNTLLPHVLTALAAGQRAFAAQLPQQIGASTAPAAGAGQEVPAAAPTWGADALARDAAWRSVNVGSPFPWTTQQVEAAPAAPAVAAATAPPLAGEGDAWWALLGVERALREGR